MSQDKLVIRKKSQQYILDRSYKQTVLTNHIE